MALALQGVAEVVDELTINYDVLCVACGTATTFAGLINRVADNKRVLGFAALKGADFLQADVQQMLGNQPYEHKNGSICLDYHFGGFAKVKPVLVDFMQDFEQAQGIQLEPVYTGKMLYGIELEENSFHTYMGISLTESDDYTYYVQKFSYPIPSPYNSISADMV